MGLITGLISNYLLSAALAIIVGVFLKVCIRYFGNDRTAKIKETILTSMLWAEEQFGIGHGDEKWTKAWQKIVELLQKQGIKLTEKEIPVVTDIMKSNVPKINEITYNALPPEATLERKIFTSTPEYKVLVDRLRKKYPVDKK